MLRKERRGNQIRLKTTKGGKRVEGKSNKE